MTIRTVGTTGDFQTIQAAINAAQAGDTIQIAAGTYNEHVDVNKDVTLQGANAGIAGSAARGAESVITGGMKISADGATVDGVAISGSYDTAGTPDITAPSHIGLLIGAANVAIDNSVLTGDAFDSRPFGTTSLATGLSFDHNLVQDWTNSAYFTAGSAGSITNNAFVDNAGGVFSEGMSFAVTGNSFSGSTGADVGGYVTAATFDIGTVVHDNTYSAGVARPISVYVFGGDGEVVNGSDTPTNFHLEYHTGSATIHGGAGSDAISYSDDSAGVTINLGAGTATGVGGTTTFTSIENAIGGSGNDTITGSAGANVIYGGAGTDTVIYSGTLQAAAIKAVADADPATAGNQAGWQVSAGAEGTDLLNGVEKVTDGAGHHFLLVGNGGFTTIQAAINAAVAGDTIEVAAGTYNENLTINKALTIVGANAGVAGTGVRGAETVISWATGNAVTLTTTSAVVIDGLEFDGTHVTGNTGQQNANLTFTNSVFDLTAGGNGSNNFYLSQPASFTFTNNLLDATGYTGALFQPVGDPADPSHSVVTFTGNTFNGHAGTYVGGDDNDVPLILNLSDVNGTVSGNTFSNVDIGVLLGNGTGPLTISGNSFDDMHREPGTTGGGFAAGIVFFTPNADLGPVTISNNTFADADAGIRLSGTPGASIAGLPIAIDGNQFTSVDHPAYQPAGGVLHLTNSTVDGVSVPSEFVAGSSSDTIANTAANDVISTDGSTDTVTYTGTLTAANITAVVDGDPTTAGNQAGWQVSAGAEGTDLLTGVDKVTDGAGHHFLLVGNGGFATIYAAMSAAQSGDTILIGPGTFNIGDGAPAGQNTFGSVGSGHLPDNVTFVGAGEGQTIIIGNPRIAADAADFGTGVANGLTLKNMTLQYSGGNQYILQWDAGNGGHNLTLENVALTGTSNGNANSGNLSAVTGADGLTLNNVTITSPPPLAGRPNSSSDRAMTSPSLAANTTTSVVARSSISLTARTRPSAAPPSRMPGYCSRTPTPMGLSARRSRAILSTMAATCG